MNDQSAPAIGERARNRLGRQQACGVLGLIAQASFMVGWLVSETWQGHRYSPVKHNISDLQAVTAPHAWFPITCFAIGGLGTFAFATFGLRPALRAAGTTAAYAPWLLALAALALGNSFPQIPCRLADPGCSAHNQLHSPGGMTDAILSGAAFFVLVLTPFPLWRRLAVLPQWRKLKPVMLAARIVGPACFLAFAICSSMPSTPAVGLIERILVTTSVLWVSALAIELIVASPAPST
jgi:hypothetical protein